MWLRCGMWSQGMSTGTLNQGMWLGKWPEHVVRAGSQGVWSGHVARTHGQGMWPGHVVTACG